MTLVTIFCSETVLVTSATAALNAGSLALALLLWTSTISPDFSGKPASSRIVSALAALAVERLGLGRRLLAERLADHEDDHDGREPAEDGGLAVPGTPVPGAGGDALGLGGQNVPLQQGGLGLGEEDRLSETFIRPGWQASGGSRMTPTGGVAVPPATVWSSSVAMAPSGESHSIFVVQQTFRTVRRGYDPDEVDRHLELVAEMFRSSRDVQLRARAGAARGRDCGTSSRRPSSRPRRRSRARA